MESTFTKNFSLDGQNTSRLSCKTCENLVKSMSKIHLRKYNDQSHKIDPILVFCACFLQASFHFILFSLL